MIRRPNLSLLFLATVSPSNLLTMTVVLQAFVTGMLVLLSPPPAAATTVTNGIHITAFASAKNRKRTGGGGGKKSKKTTASTNRGFGAPPPTLMEALDEIQTSTKNRKRYDLKTMEVLEQQPCPCGLLSSSLTYSECCQPLHRAAQSTGFDESPCMEPLQVLQSRYTAFSMRNIGYIISTTHPKCRDYREDRVSWAKSLDKDGMFDSFNFVKLDVLDDEGNGDDSNANDKDEAFLSFQVTLQKKKGLGIDDSEDDSDESPKTTIVTERSRFLRNPTNGSWTYAGGDVRSNVAGLQDTPLNQ